MNSVPMAIDESFLLLFFKKEVLFFFLFLFVYLGSYLFFKKESASF